MKVSRQCFLPLIVVMNLFSAGAVHANGEAVRFPATPAGKLAELRLKAFNSGKPELLEAFKRAHDANLSVDNELGLRQMTGGLDPIRIEKSEDAHIIVILREKDGDRVGRMELEIDALHPKQLSRFSLMPMASVPDDLMPPRLKAAQVWSKLLRKAKQLESQERWSGSFAAARGGKILHEQSWNFADRGAHQKNTSQTRYRIGSMYKMLTAVAILQLVEQGRLDLNAPISTYLPTYPNQTLAAQLTVKQLLTHTGGTGDIFTEEFAQKREQLREHKDYLEQFGHRIPTFPPGTQEEYSNYGYVLLGAIIEAVCQKPYHQVIAENILQVAEMKDTGSEPEAVIAPSLSIGYMATESGLKDNQNTLPWRGTAAGGGYSTTGDLIRFGQALLAGRLISTNTLTQAITAQTASQLVGLGFQLGGKARTAYFGHDGGAPGMSGALRIYPASGDIIVALSNFDPPASDELVQYYANRMPLNEPLKSARDSTVATVTKPSVKPK